MQIAEQYMKRTKQAALCYNYIIMYMVYNDIRLV